MGIKSTENAKARIEQDKRTEAWREYRRKMEGIAVVTDKLKDERDILNQGFLPESMDGLKLVQNCAWIVYTLFKGPERSWNSHRDQDPSTTALSTKHSNWNIK